MLTGYIKKTTTLTGTLTAPSGGSDITATEITPEIATAVTYTESIGTLPLNFSSSGSSLEDFTIYGASGGVGDLDSSTGKYKIPITVTNTDTDESQTVTILRDAPLGIGDSISKSEIGITIPVYSSNSLTIGTSVQPSKVYIQYQD